MSPRKPSAPRCMDTVTFGDLTAPPWSSSVMCWQPLGHDGPHKGSETFTEPHFGQEEPDANGNWLVEVVEMEMTWTRDVRVPA